MNFERKVGPKADAYELEYVSALFQTRPKSTRESSTISSIDVMRYLMSRFAIEVSHQHAREIVDVFGGGDVSKEVKEATIYHVHEKIEMEKQARKKLQEAIIRRRPEFRRLPNKPNFVPSTAKNKQDGDEEGEGEEKEEEVSAEEKKRREEDQALLNELNEPKISYLDIVQTASVLLIPTMARYGRDWKVHNTTIHHPYVSEIERVEVRLKEIHNNDGVNEKEEGNSGSVEVGLGDSKTSKERDEEAIDVEGGRQNETLTSSNDDKRDVKMIETTAADSSMLTPPVYEDNEEAIQLALRYLWNQTSSMSANQKAESENKSTSTDGPPVLTEDLIRTMLMKNGELERANDNDLIKSMYEMAQSPSGRFDEHAMVNALTSDLVGWKVGSEDDVNTTYIHDVLGDVIDNNFERLGGEEEYKNFSSSKDGVRKKDDGTDNKTNTEAMEVLAGSVRSQPETVTKDSIPADQRLVEELQCTTSDLEHETSTREENGKNTIHIRSNTGTIYDTVIDAYGSSLSSLLIWMVFIFSSLAYASILISGDVLAESCGASSFSCVLLETILSWIIVAPGLVAMGFVIIVPLSIGNHPTKRSPATLLVSATIAFLMAAVVPYVAANVSSSDDEASSEAVAIGSVSFSGAINQILASVATLFGYSLAFQYTCQSVLLICQNKGNLRDQSFFHTRIVPSDKKGTVRQKHSASRKLSRMVLNAIDVHNKTILIPEKIASNKDEEDGDDVDRVQKSFLRSLLNNATTIDRILLTYAQQGESHESVGSFFWVWKWIFSGRLFEEEGIWLPTRVWIFNFGQLILGGVMSFAFFNIVPALKEAADNVYGQLPATAPESVFDVIPTGTQVESALYPAAATTSFTALALILLYIPSTISTILKMRSGQIRTFGTAEYNDIRANPDFVYMNIANALYGLVPAAGFCGSLVGLVVFLFVWPVSKDAMIYITGWCIGITVTVLLKMVVTACFRSSYLRAFYRIRPGKANIANLALECWYFGLGAGVAIFRLCQFLLAAAFWVGRIDEPFLAENVDVLGYKFDYLPMYYRTELLSHEAHRHPYIERLGAMYLMRLRNKNFGSDAGACWRQLFVVSLMPWLLQRRVFYEQRCIDSVTDQEYERAFEEKEHAEEEIAEGG